MVADRKTGKFMTFNLWESETDARGYETSGGFQADLEADEGSWIVRPVREVYAVVAEK